MATQRARPARAGSTGALSRARLRPDHGDGDRRAGRTHGADVLPVLRRQARGAVLGSGEPARALREDHRSRAGFRRADRRGRRGPGGRCPSVARAPRTRPAAPGRDCRNPGLQERELSKRASLATAMADALRGRGVPEPAASLAAEAGVIAFKTAFARWVDDPHEQDLARLIRQALDQLKATTAGTGSSVAD